MSTPTVHDTTDHGDRTLTPRDRWAGQRRELERRHAALLGEDRATTPADQPLATLGETEHLSAYEQRSIDAALDALAERELAGIARALDRLEEGTYGTCEVCGTDIADERLVALPAATTCVNCPGPVG